MSAHHDWLHDLLHHLEHILPAQAPIKDFVHHNTLHGFQHLPFREALAAAEAATGSHGYQPPASFRAYFAQGRIDRSDLDAALTDTAELAPDTAVLPGILRRDVLAVALIHDLSPITAASLEWRLNEDALTQPASGGRLAGPALADLWLATGSVLQDRAAHHTVAADEYAIKAAAEARLATLFAGLTTLREVLQQLTGRDVLDAVRPYLIRHLASHLDLGMAAWHNPERPRGLYAAWLASAKDDPHFQLNDLDGWQALLERLPSDAGACIVQEIELLGLAEAQRAPYLEALAKELPGWSGMVLWRHEHPGYEGEATPIDMADYLAMRLVLERVAAQRLASAHFKTEASIHGLRAYLHHHPAELLVRLALYADRVPENLQDHGHRLVREAVNRRTEEDDADWLPVAKMLLGEGPHSPSPSKGEGRGGGETSAPVDRLAREPASHPLQEEGPEHQSPALNRWPLFLLCQHLGIDGERLRVLGSEGAAKLLAVLADLTRERMGWVWLQAYERHYREQILTATAANVGRGPWKTRETRASAQLVLCMDDREEGLRRHLEEISPSVETLGAAAHYNVPHAWRGLDETRAVPLAPVVPTVVVPAHEVQEKACDAALFETHARRHATRMQWRAKLHQNTRLGLLTPTLMALAAAPFTLPLLAGKAFAPAFTGRLVQGLRRGFDKKVATRIDFTAPNDSPEARPDNRRLGFTDVEQADRVQLLLRNTGLTYGFAPLVVIMGHGSHSQNNPHGSAYNCGACAGRWSGPNARLVASMANREPVREILAGRGIVIPADTWFIGSEHDTCDDIVTWYDEDQVPVERRPDLVRLQADVEAACRLHAQERCRRFMSAPLSFTPKAAWNHVTGRANDWSQARPELGHATNACAFFGRRSLTRGAFFDRRAFLISYDPSQDPDGSVLERHLVINGAVGAGISLEYYFSSANNERYGCSTKVMHNVAGLIGVMEGASSDLRTGLPRQMIEVHEAMRLLVIVEHKLDVLTAIYQRQPAVAELVGNAWVQLAAIDPDTAEIHRFIVGRGWEKWLPQGPDLPHVRRSGDWVLGQREPLPPVLIDAAVATGGQA